MANFIALSKNHKQRVDELAARLTRVEIHIRRGERRAARARLIGFYEEADALLGELERDPVGGGEDGFLDFAVTEAAAEATNAQRKIAADDGAAILETLKSDGCDIIELTAIERQSFVAALSDLMGEYRELIGPHLFAELDSH